MTANLKPYPAMKPTGVEWLGDVPEHWEVRPNRALVRQRRALVGERHPSYRLLSLTKQGVIVRDVESGVGKFSSDMGTSQEVRAGDLVFCLFDVPETPRTVGLSTHDGMITGAYTVFECFGTVLPIYFELFYRAMDDRKLLSPLYSGLRNTIPPNRFLSARTPLPPLEEQAAIVRYLDHADRRMNRYIRAKQRLIELLEEEKQAMTHQAVTRGLDPDVPLRPSGVEWLGDVPEHWPLMPNRVLVRQRRVLVGERHSSYPLLSLTKQGVIVRDVESGKGKFSSDMRTSQEVRTGDLVFCLFDVPETPRTVGLSGNDGMITGAYTVVECLDSVLATYFELFYRAMDDRKLLSPLYSGLRNTIPPASFLGAKTPIPPLPEQATIVRYIQHAAAATDDAIDRARREVRLLHEYRTRLTADVVTGKLDVREAAARLPEVDHVDRSDVFERAGPSEDGLAAELEEVAP